MAQPERQGNRFVKTASKIAFDRRIRAGVALVGISLFCAGEQMGGAVNLTSDASPNISRELLDGVSKIGSTENVKAQIEEAFDIRLFSGRSLYGENGSAVRAVLKGSSGVQEWDGQRLILLSALLQELPKSFYAPGENGKKTIVILGASDSCGSMFPGFGQERVIEVSPDRFNPEKPKEAKRVLAHELTHLKTLAECGSEESKYWSRVDEVVGGPFAQKRIQLLERLTQKGADPTYRTFAGALMKENIKTRADEKIFRYGRLEYGFDSDYPIEFLAVAGEVYVFGKDYFNDVYSEIFSQESTSKLYELMREIFEGREY